MMSCRGIQTNAMVIVMMMCKELEIKGQKTSAHNGFFYCLSDCKQNHETGHRQNET